MQIKYVRFGQVTPSGVEAVVRPNRNETQPTQRSEALVIEKSDHAPKKISSSLSDKNSELSPTSRKSNRSWGAN